MALRFVLGALLAAAAPPRLALVAAQQIPDLSGSTTCAPGSSCYNRTVQGIVYETSQRALPGSPYYTVPLSFSEDLPPGSLLSVEVATNLRNYTVPAGLTMSRLLYTSTNLDGRVLPASAYILWPATLPSEQPGSSNPPAFPMVAWAHGTSGIFEPCAPSNYKALQYNFMVPFALALQGMVVVAPDYAGIGVGEYPDGEPIPHVYGALPAHANDVANAILAAREAFPILDPSPFVTAGHSQGGAIAWSFAERQARRPVAGYRGTLAFAAGTDFIGTVIAANEALARGVTDPWVRASLGLVQHSTIAGITAMVPSFNFTGMTSIVRDRFFNVASVARTCLAAYNLLVADIPSAQLSDSSWTDTSVAQDFRKRTAAAGKEFAGPLLVIAGGADSAVPVGFIEKAVDATCAAVDNADLEFVVYEGQDHFPVIQASQSYWMQWIKDRLHGPKPCRSAERPRPASCVKRNVSAFRAQFNQQYITPNWLVTQAPPSAPWQYSI
ncbi:Alpha/Beta hydrolase protein [Stachybotrys elegans]|uniref:Alpha/Beta hydrolase protein n=1 Tax=Stachybotrys elegans TaxID=80388 RepID=A0A8K0WN67_9HYPO|nr:Alpha/Beta hydrolase protein [Stachybotrys elegans]